MVAIMVDALVWVEIEAVEVIVTMEPDRLMFCAATVMLRVPSEDASAVICVGRTVDQVEAVEDGVLHDGGDLVAQGDEVLRSGPDGSPCRAKRRTPQRPWSSSGSARSEID